MNLFLFGYWMPTVFNLIGMSPADAVFASSLRDCGAIFAVLSRRLDRPRRPGTLAGMALRRRRAVHRRDRADCAALRAAAGGHVPLRDDDHRQPDRRPTRPAASSIRRGCARPGRLGARIGRLGGIAAPVLGGWLLSLGMAPTHISSALLLRSRRGGGHGALGVSRCPRRNLTAQERPNESLRFRPVGL